MNKHIGRIAVLSSKAFLGVTVLITAVVGGTMLMKSAIPNRESKSTDNAEAKVDAL